MANGMPKDYKYVECRLFKHNWQLYDDSSNDATFNLECTRCTCLRHDWVLANTGQIRKRRYEYPMNYHLKREERPNANQLRRNLMARLRSSKR